MIIDPPNYLHRRVSSFSNGARLPARHRLSAQSKAGGQRLCASIAGRGALRAKKLRQKMTKLKT